jgi:hypothetical protein
MLHATGCRDVSSQVGDGDDVNRDPAVREVDADADSQNYASDHPTGAFATPSQEQEGGEGRDEGKGISDSEKVLFVLAAFDADEDGRLNFEEVNKLQQATHGSRISREAFARACAEVGTNPEVGLGQSELAALYERFGTLERDFLVSLERLQGGSTNRRGGGRGAGCAFSSSRVCGAPERLLPLLALTLAVACPLVGVPLVFFATKKSACHRCA